MKAAIRIGTRQSPLALWQANKVKSLLEEQGHTCVLVPINSQGDLNLEQPLYELGVVGVFTKTLDAALLADKIDLAVHSMKDMPTALPQGIALAAVLARADSHDILVHKGTDFLNGPGTIATGSLRRKAQWLHKYPQHEVVGLRGNVQTRLQKLQDNAWNGAIFAKAGLQRVDLLPTNYQQLDWMIPAPAQGAVAVVAKQKDGQLLKQCEAIADKQTTICTTVERQFLRTLEGGCTAPIGAFAKIENEQLHFKGCLHSLDGQEALYIERSVSTSEANGLGEKLARELLDQGGAALMEQIRKEL